MNTLPTFNGNSSLTMGVELELQLVDLHHFNLAKEAEDFLRRLSKFSYTAEFKPEITQGMIEVNSSIHDSYHSLLKELLDLRNLLAKEAKKAHIGICGGGTHPFQKWKQQRIFSSDRFNNISEQYGYLAQQFTVFGQHIHIACKNGDDALYLCHAMAKYLPHFIALSAASPFNQGVNTAFDCSRLAVISAFPLSGAPPWILSWEEFATYYAKVASLGIATSMKDFYWDIRPKPEYGTVELRICDSPLNVIIASDLAAYMQMLVRYLLDEKPALSQDIYLTYQTNRFRAARYGLEATILDPIQHTEKPLVKDILDTCDLIENHAAELDSLSALNNIRISVRTKENGARWLRDQYSHLNSLNDTVREQAKLWLGLD